MTARGFYTLFFGALMLFTALSVSSAGAFLLGAAALICCLFSLLCVLIPRCFLRVTQDMPEKEVLRGGVCRYVLRLLLPFPAPIAPVFVKLYLPGGKTSELSLSTKLWGETVSENRFACPHVGVYPVGITQLVFSDCFGLFSLKRTIKTPLSQLIVLPRPAVVKALSFSPGEGESSAAQRAQADHSTPEDVRSWQDGDELKRVHWKLSARKQTLMVHTYETPQRPDALLLLNASLPETADAQRPVLTDALTEVTAGTAKVLLDAGRLTRLPLSGTVKDELSGQNPEALPAIYRALALEGFTEKADFSRVLWDSARRTRRTGSIAIVSAELTPAIADAAIALTRMGPRARFTLITPGEASEPQRQLLTLLQSSGMETAHIKAC